MRAAKPVERKKLVSNGVGGVRGRLTIGMTPAKQ